MKRPIVKAHGTLERSAGEILFDRCPFVREQYFLFSRVSRVGFVDDPGAFGDRHGLFRFCMVADDRMGDLFPQRAFVGRAGVHFYHFIACPRRVPYERVQGVPQADLGARRPCVLSGAS